jgi:hypothetical protein
MAVADSTPLIPRSQDAEDRGTDAESGLGQVSAQQAVVPFSALYNILGQRLATERGAERSVLLLYLLLHGCQPFQVRSICECFGRVRTSCAHMR